MSRIIKYILIGLSALLFLYTTTKAYLLAITWDEAYSYLDFVRNGVFIQEKFDGMSANNHLLNTWLQILLVKCFGVHEFVLRIPALFAHLLFLIYSAKLVSQFHNKWLVIASFLIINLNPYLIDFFSLARGYGLSIGFMMASIYYLYVFHKEWKTGMASLSIFLSTLAVLSNFVILNYMMALYSIIFLLCLYKSKTENASSEKFGFWKKIRIPTLIFFLALAFILPIGLELKKADALFFGSPDGFWKGTVYSIVDRYFFELGYNYWVQRIAKVFIILVIVTACIRSVIQIRRKQFSQNSLFLISTLLILAMCVVSTILQHWLFKTPYLLDRTALFLVVLFTIILVFFINEQSIEKPWTLSISYVTAVLTIIHMSLSFNLDYVLEWKLDMNTKEMLVDLEEIKKVSSEKGNISVNIPLWFEQGINFYRDIYKLTWLNQASRSKTRSRLDDYYYLSQKELAMISPDSVEVLKTYKVTQNVLVKPKHQLNEVKIRLNQELTFENEPDHTYFIKEDEMYSKGFSYIVDDSIAACKQAVIVYEIEAKPTLIKESNLMIVISLDDNNQQNYLWKPAHMLDYINYSDANQWTKILFTCVVPAKIKAGDKLSMYLWNPHKDELLVKKMRLKWLEYQ